MDHLLRKYLVPLFAAPDDTGAGDPPADPPVADVVAGDPPAPVAEPPAPPQTVPLSVVSGLRAKNRELEDRATAAERQAADARALAERLQRGQQPPADQAAPAPPPTPPQPLQNDEIERQAAALVFQRDAKHISETGLATYGQGWVQAVAALDAYGINSPAFVADVMEIAPGRVHDVMFQIAQDGERAVQLAQMTPARRAAEITRIAMAASAPDAPAPAAPAVPAKPAPRVGSRAPAPPPPVTPSASKTVDWRSDEASDADFDRGFWKNLEERGKRSAFR